MSGVGTAIGIAAAVGGAASIGGAAIESSAAGKAAGTQASAADESAQLQYKESQNALAFQQQEFDTQQQNLKPWLQEGKSALNNLSALTSKPGQGLLTPYGQTFTAPTLEEAENQPGYKFAEQQGEGAINNSAAAKGDLVSGNAAEAEDQFAQNNAETNYGNVYNQALQTFGTNYGVFENNQTNEFNRLSALSGTGQTAATTLGTEGQQAAQDVSNIDLTAGAQQGADLQNAAAAEASGYVGSANAISGGLNGVGSNLTTLALLSQLNGGNLNPGTMPGGVSNPSPYPNSGGYTAAV